jgi:hypothetical protein
VRRAGSTGRPARPGARWRIALLLVPLHAAASLAQTGPASVNDCTLLPDPGALRRCLDQVEGRAVDPAGPSKAPASPALETAEAERAPPRTVGAPPPKHPGGFLDDRAHAWDSPVPGRAVIDLR